MILGAIDVGTNAVRLSISKLKIEKNGVDVERVFYARVPLRLGKDVFEKGRVSKKKSDQFVKTMHAFRLLAEVHGVEQLRAVATSAMREATNAQEILNLIQEDAGIHLEVISGEEEALLILESFDFLERINKDAFIIIDVGGGSTEVSVFENGHRIASRSFNLGTLRLISAQVVEEEWSDLNNWLIEHVDHTINHSVYGTGGNIRKINSLLAPEESAGMQTADMEDLFNRMRILDVHQRQKLFHLKPDRAEVIVPALELFLFILGNLKSPTIFAPKLSLSDGIMLHAFRKMNGI